MIIDAYNLVWKGEPNSPLYQFRNDLPVEALLASMDAAGVDEAVISNFEGGHASTHDFLIETLARHPNRLHGLAHVNPVKPEAVDELRSLARNHHFIGIKLHPPGYGYNVGSHSLLDRIFEVCAEERLMVFGHSLGEAFTMPLAYEEMARSFPTVNFVIQHMGFLGGLEEACYCAARTPNLYLETSAVPQRDIAKGIMEAGPEKVIYGTAWPANDHDLAQEMARRACNGDAGAARLVLGDNLARLLAESGSPLRKRAAAE